MTTIARLLVANRGEIAVRVVAGHKLGIDAVVAVSEADRETVAARRADEADTVGLVHDARLAKAVVTGAGRAKRIDCTQDMALWSEPQ